VAAWATASRLADGWAAESGSAASLASKTDDRYVPREIKLRTSVADSLTVVLREKQGRKKACRRGFFLWRVGGLRDIMNRANLPCGQGSESKRKKKKKN